MNTFTDLNTNEIEVLKAISIASDCNGGDFTYFEDAMKHINSLTEKQVKGYISQLSQKKYIVACKDGKYTQLSSGIYVDYLTEYEF